jgi:hypothetical protein
MSDLKRALEAEAEVKRLRRVIQRLKDWRHYPIDLPVTADGKGPAIIGEDAAYMTYEVWDDACISHGLFTTMRAAINLAMRLNSPTEATP